MQNAALFQRFCKQFQESLPPRLMKRLFLLIHALVAACALVSCNSAGSLYGTGSSSSSFGPPTMGPPYSKPGYDPYSPYYANQAGYHRRIPSPPGSYHFIYHDSARPLPLNTPLKEKTWRYTSRHPSHWGTPIWVTTRTPRCFLRWTPQGASPNLAPPPAPPPHQVPISSPRTAAL